MSQAETFGGRLRRLRLSAGLTQRQLSDGSLDASYISLLERDRRQPTEKTIRILAARLGCDTRSLIEGAEGSDADVLLAKAELGLGNLLEAMHLVDATVKRVGARPIEHASDFEAVEVYAAALERTGDSESAARWLERLYKAAEQDPLRFPIIRVSVALVRCHADAANYLRAVQVGEQSARLQRELKLTWTAEYGALLSTLASAYARAGDAAYASNLLLDLAAEAAVHCDNQGAAYALWNAAIVAVSRGHVADGRDLISRAVALLDDTDDLRNQSRIRSAQASLLLLQSPPDAAAARRILRSELPTLRQHNGTLSVARAEIELARCELLLGHPQVARRLAASATGRLPESHLAERAEAGVVHAISLAACGEHSLAIGELGESIETLLSIGALRQAANAANELASVYECMGDTERALVSTHHAVAILGITSTLRGSRQDKIGPTNKTGTSQDLEPRGATQPRQVSSQP